MAKKTWLNLQQSYNGGLFELKRRLIFVIGAIIIFRIGSFIPIPGVNTIAITKLFEHQKGTIIEIFNMFSGGALSRASIFALGIMPYISSSIIVQLITVINSSLADLKKEGDVGQRKINQYICYGTLVLAIFQSIGISIGLPNMLGMQSLIISSGFSFYFIAVVSLVCGTMFLMWLGEQITERGISNGISVIIFAGIVSGLPPAVINTIEQVRQGSMHFIIFFFVAILVFVVTFFVIFVELGQRRILVNYAKHQQGRRFYLPQNTHLPLKINMAGVVPAIFSSSIILFPTTIIAWFGNGIHWKWLTTILFYLQPGKPFYILIYAFAIIFFCFFYTALVFNPRETADNLKKSGAFISGIRPGEQTAKYINKIMTRLTLVGAFYITFVCLIPEFMREAMKVPFYFGGTSLLIVVVVIMDFMTQIKTLMISSQYGSILKKANIKGYNR